MAIDHLAVFGGEPTFSAKLHVGRPNLGDRARLLERVGEMLDRLWFTNNGPLVQEFERRVEALVKVKHCIATSNATIALELATRALELKGEVIVPAFTFIATAHALRWQGITPVFCDIDPLSHNMDPSKIEAAITPDTTGIIGVHLWGRPCEVEKLQSVASEHGLKLVFDAAHALGSSCGGRPVGSFGDAEVFSFHATKFVNSFEGGAITTNDDRLAARIRLMKNFGFSGYDNVVTVGTNGKMTEICAAMGLTSLEAMDSFARLNRANHSLYAEGLSGLQGLKLLKYDPNEAGNYQYVVLEIDNRQASMSRDALRDVLWAENVLARRYFFPGCHRSEPYATEWNRWPLPVTDAVAARVLSLPTGGGVSAADIDKICQLIRLAFSQAPEISRRLAQREGAGLA